MDIHIATFWGFRVTKYKKSLDAPEPEEYLKTHPNIDLCDIAIDGQLRGTVRWNGKELSLELLNPYSLFFF